MRRRCCSLRSDSACRRRSSPVSTLCTVGSLPRLPTEGCCVDLLNLLYGQCDRGVSHTCNARSVSRREGLWIVPALKKQISPAARRRSREREAYGVEGAAARSARMVLLTHGDHQIFGSRSKYSSSS